MIASGQKGYLSYVAGKLTAVTVQEHALNSLRNEPNLLLQPILQNCLSILTLNPKKQQHILKKKIYEKQSLPISQKRKQLRLVVFPVSSRTLENCRENKKIARNYTIFVDERMGKK